MELEEPLILHRILSFLTTKQAAKTSLISKAWLEAWRTRPTLEFDDENLFLNPSAKNSAANLSAVDRVRAQQRIIRNFSRYVETTIRRYSDRKLRIDTLKIRLFGGVISKSVILESIRIAIENNVRTLDLDLDVSLDLIELGGNVFGSKSLVNLKLHMGKLRTLSIDQIRCHNIKRLDFYMVCLDELMFENIIHGCPLLELLKVGRLKRVGEGDYYDGDGGDDDEEDGGGAPLLRVEKHANLRKIDFELLKFQSFLVGELPKLELLVCTNDESYLDLQEQLSVDWMLDFQEGLLVDWMPCWFALQSPRYQNIHTLVFCGVGMGDDFFNNFAYMFPNVENLSIQYCHNLRILKLLSPSIKRIGLDENRELKEAHFDVPRIVCFQFRTLLDLAPVVSFTAVSSGWVSSLAVDCWYGGGPSLLFRKLKDLLSGLYQSEIFLRIRFPLKIPEFNVEEIRNIFVSSKPVMVQELSVSFPANESMSSTLPILNSIFWVCRPRIIKQHLGDILCMKLLYGILVLKINPDQIQGWIQRGAAPSVLPGSPVSQPQSRPLSSTTDQIRFWQIDVKDVQVGTFTSDILRGCENRIQQRRTCIDFHPLNVYELLEMGDNVLDWEGFLLLSRSIAGAQGICFRFEWRGLQNESVNGSH